MCSQDLKFKTQIYFFSQMSDIAYQRFCNKFKQHDKDTNDLEITSNETPAT